MIDEYIYRTFTPNGSKYCCTKQEAIEYYNKNDGFLVISKTKDLFPQYDVILEKPYVSGRVWLVIRKFKKPCC